MVQIRVGEGEVIVYTCKCGAIIKGEAALSEVKTKLGSAGSALASDAGGEKKEAPTRQCHADVVERAPDLRNRT